MTDDELDVAFWREKTYEYRDMRAELKRLVRTLRHTGTCYMEGTFADGGKPRPDPPWAVAGNCADAIEEILRKSAATKTTEKETTLKRLVTEWRDKEATNRRAVFAIGEHFAAADTYERCADDLEAVLRRTVAAELTRMAQEDGEHE